MTERQVTGLSLALVVGPEVAWAEGFGYANRDAGTRATPDTIYKICSVTKLFTAVAVMQLVEQRKLDLDQPVAAYVPEFAMRGRFPQSGPITVRSLMTHHSGMPTDKRSGNQAASADERPVPFSSALEYLRGTYVAYPVNHVFSYSNLGIDQLGIVLERVSGESYESYLEHHILGPLGMKDSFVWTEGRSEENLSMGFHRGKGVWEPMLRDIPAGGLHSSVTDMTRFVGMVNGEGTFQGVQILREETLNQMFTPQNTGIPLDFNLVVGLNWMLSRPSLGYSGKLGWPDGSSQHFNTAVIVLPSEQVGVVVLCNSDSGALVVQQVADDVVKAALETYGRTRVQPVARKPGPRLQPAGLETYAGEYPSVNLGLVKLQVTEGLALLKLKGLPTALVPDGDGWFRLRLALLGRLSIPLKQLAGLRVSFQTIEAEKVLVLEQLGLQFAVARRIERQPVNPAWRAGAGKYRNVADHDLTLPQMELKCTQDLLWIEGRFYKLGKMRVYLQPANDKEALLLGLGRWGNETVFLSNEGGKSQIELLGMRFERIR